MAKRAMNSGLWILQFVMVGSSLSGVVTRLTRKQWTLSKKNQTTSEMATLPGLNYNAELNSYGKVPRGTMVNIVIVATANYLWGAAVTVRSALEACSTTLNVYVICVDLSKADKQQLLISWQASNLGAIEFIDFDLERVSKFRSTLLVKSKSSYARIFIPEYLANVSRCVYLDTDLIVCSDLTELQHLDLLGKSSACVLDGGNATPEQQQRLRDKLKLVSCPGNNF
jgi:hypothetical protein